LVEKRKQTGVWKSWHQRLGLALVKKRNTTRVKDEDLIIVRQMLASESIERTCVTGYTCALLGQR
jgi:hypothetical protein